MGGCKVIVVGGMQAGVGKSTVTVGLMAALRQRGLRVQGFKVGPDLLDPLLHEAATGKPSYNLDGWMLTKEHNLSVAQRLAGDADVAVVEGGDGLYDGTFGDEEGSTGQLAKWLGAPVVLVLDCDGLPARSAAALLKGHLAFDDELPIAGVILNKTKDASHEKLIRDSIENAGIGAPIFGALRRDDAGLGMLRDEGQGPHSALAAAAAKAAAALDAGGAASVGGSRNPYASHLIDKESESKKGGNDDAFKGKTREIGMEKESGDPNFVTGVAAQLADVVGKTVDLTAVMNAAWEFTGPLEDTHVEEEEAVAVGASGAQAGTGEEAGSSSGDPNGIEGVRGEGEAVLWEASFGARRLSLDDDGNVKEGAASENAGVKATEGPVGLRTKTAPDRLDSFGGKDRNKFPVIPESPKRAASGSHAGSPLRTNTPKKEHSFGRALVGGVVARLGRGVGNGASHLIPRPLFSNTVRVGVARDAAFCHYYRENLALLREYGADLVPFSPIAGDSLPQGCKGILFGGGYPEMYAQELTGNRSLRAAITAFAAGGGVIYGECGGLMFLSQALISRDQGAQPRPMCGLAPFSTRVAAAPASSYAEITVRHGCPLFPAGARARGRVHRNSEIVAEPPLGDGPGQSGWFGAYDVRPPEEAWCGNVGVGEGPGVKGDGAVGDVAGDVAPEPGPSANHWEAVGRVEGYAWRNVLMSYARLHWGESPEMARHFVDVCKGVPAAAAEAALKAAAAARKLPPVVPSTPGSYKISMPRVKSTDSMSEMSSHGGNMNSLGALGSGTSINQMNGETDEYGHESNVSPMSAGGSDRALNDRALNRHRRTHSEDHGPMDDTRMGMIKSSSGGGTPSMLRSSSSNASLGGGASTPARRGSVPDFLDHEALLSFPPPLGLGGSNDDLGYLEDTLGHLHTPSAVPQPPPSRTCTIASLTPAATEIIHALGLQSRLVCVTDRCNFPPSVARAFPIVLRSNTKVRNTKQGGMSRPQSIGSLMTSANKQLDSSNSPSAALPGMSVDVEWLRRTRPGLVLTQDACERCGAAGPGGDSVVARALVSAGLLGAHSHNGGEADAAGSDSGKSGELSHDTGVLAMDPQRLSEVLDVIVQVGTAAGEEDAAVALVGSLRARLRAVTAAVAPARRRPKVLSLEGLRPLAVGGHWLPEMKHLAGGVDELQEPGAPAAGLRWEQVLSYAPEVLILAPCVSQSPDDTLDELDRLASQPGFWALPAVRSREVYVVHHVLFSRAGPRLVNGVELLAKILHPELAPDVAMREGCTVTKLNLEVGRQCRARQLRNYFRPWGGAGATGWDFTGYAGGGHADTIP